MYHLDSPTVNEHPVLLQIWEASVRATHHFLDKGDIEIFKKIIEETQAFNHVQLVCARNEGQDILGFMGISEEKLEMLFVHDAAFGKGIGKMLLLHAIENLHVTQVDVNEQNEQALKFYEHFGFTVRARSDRDGSGKPYPILHMQLATNPQ